MKKITFVLFALIAGSSFAQTTISSSAEIIEAITFVQDAGLSFGKVDNTAGTVIIATDGTVSGSKTQVGGTTTAGALTVSGESGENYIIYVSNEATLTGPNETMNVSQIGHNGLGVLGTNGEETFQIGGTLNVGAGQETGLYTGTISVTVSYN